MGTYEIPRNLRGESRILYIFTVKALITTAGGLGIGFIFNLIFSAVGLPKVGIVLMAIFALIGYGLGMIKIPTVGGIPITKKIGGESLDQIIIRYIKFTRNRKKYICTKEEKENADT